MSRIQPLADEFVTVCESPDPARVFCYSPGLCAAPSGRLIATMELASNEAGLLEGVSGFRRINRKHVQGKVFLSDDHGQTWRHVHDYPFMHARPFVAADALYVLGHCGDLMIIRSEDGGLTWSEPARLTDGEDWTQAPCNVLLAKGNVYLVMTRIMSYKSWFANAYAPILMRADVRADLLDRGSWTMASPLTCRDVVSGADLDYFGVPFYPEDTVLAPGRKMSRIGWLETHVAQFADPDHLWHDAGGRTFHLWSRAQTGSANYAAVAKVVEQPDGSMVTELERAPSGKRALFVPCPGGHMKFHLIYDEVSALYWLLSSQTTDSMTRIDRLPPDRFGLPNNERHRLVLHYSKNCIDWCFAGLVARGETPKHSRHYASMIADGDDLLILSRSGDARARSAHDGNLITFHTVRRFRDLVY